MTGAGGINKSVCLEEREEHDAADEEDTPAMACADVRSSVYTVKQYRS